ncbi:MAG: hypothetical protein ACK40K_07830 [Raineya sp.]
MFQALFLVSLLYVPDPITGNNDLLEIKKWNALLKKNTSWLSEAEMNFPLR